MLRVIESVFQVLLGIILLVSIVVLIGTGKIYIQHVYNYDHHFNTLISSLIDSPWDTIDDKPQNQSILNSTTNKNTGTEPYDVEIKTKLDYLDRLYEINKDSTTNELLSFLYAFLSSILISVSTYFAHKTKENLNETEKKVQKLDKTMDPLTKTVDKTADAVKDATQKIESIGEIATDACTLVHEIEKTSKDATVAIDTIKTNTCILYCLHLLVHVSSAYQMLPSEIQVVMPKLNTSHELLKVYMAVNGYIYDNGSMVIQLYDELIDIFTKLQDKGINTSKYIKDIKSYYSMLKTK